MARCVTKKGFEVSFLRDTGQRRHVWKNLAAFLYISWKKGRDRVFGLYLHVVSGFPCVSTVLLLPAIYQAELLRHSSVE